MTDRHTSYLHGGYLDDELSPARRTEIEAHLIRCRECREDLDQLRRLRSLLGRIETPNPGPEYFAGLEERIAVMTTAQEGPMGLSISPSTRNRGGEILRTLIGLAAVITLLFTSFYISSERQEREYNRRAGRAPGSRYVQADSGDVISISAGPRAGLVTGEPQVTTQSNDSLGNIGR